jgi:hypothetical protein
MSAVPTVLWSLGIVAVGGFFLNVFLQSNVRKLLEYLHLDLILTGFVKYARENKMCWFLSGLLSGVLITSVALPYLTAANEPYVNPIHDSRVKWNITKWISGVQGNIEQLSMVKLEPCHIVIVRLQDTYAEDYARDWKELFGTIRWPVTEKLADTPIEKGISFRPIQADGKAVACANALNTTFSYYALSKRGGPLGGNYIYSYQGAEAVPTSLKECTSPCVEMDLGNPREDQ